MSLPGREKPEGFEGQRLVILPASILAEVERAAMSPSLIPTDIGVFPRAQGHLRRRAKGVEETIFIYCDAGSGWCEIAGMRHRVASGDLLIVPPSTPHTYAAEDDRPWTIYWVHANGSGIAAFLNLLEITAEHPVLHFGALSNVWRQGVSAILDAVGHRTVMRDVLFASYTLGMMLADAARHRAAAAEPETAISPAVARALALMEERIHDPLSIGAMAEAAGLSRSHFQAIFKAHTGKAPLDYFIELKMQRACWMLAGTRQTVATIADSLGYRDPLYFSRAFRAVHGVSPREYRVSSG